MKLTHVKLFVVAIGAILLLGSCSGQQHCAAYSSAHYKNCNLYACAK